MSSWSVASSRVCLACGIPRRTCYGAHRQANPPTRPTGPPISSRPLPSSPPPHPLWTPSPLVASAFFPRAADFFRSRDAALADRCQTTARQLAEAVTTHLYNRDLGRFIRGATVQADGSLTPDPALSVEA